MKSIRGLAGRVRVGAADASLTPVSGVVAVAELVDRLGVVAAFDEAVGGIKQRDRGLSAGGLLVALAQTQMLGGDFLVSLDRRRDDPVGEALSAVSTPASTTAAGLAARFDAAHLVGIATLRHRLLNVPARLVHHAGQAILRLPPGQHLLAHVLTRLRKLPAWT